MQKEKIIKFFDYIIEGGLLAIIFFIPIIFDYSLSSYNSFSLYNIILFRIILIILLLIFTAKVFISGRFNYRGSKKIFILAGLIIASFFLSSWFSLNPAKSFWGSFLRQQGFYNFFNYWLFFILLILNIESFKKLKRLIITVVVSASLVSVYGLIQYFNLDPWAWTDSALATGRIFSSLGQPNFFGHWLIMVLPLSLYAFIFIAKKTLFRFFIGLALLMQLICLIFTYSRAAWLGFLGLTSFLIIFYLFYKGFKKIGFSLVGLILVGFIFIVGLNAVSPVKLDNYNSISLVNRLKSIADFKGGSNKIRLYYLESTIKEIKQASFLRLTLGYGPEVLGDIFMKYYKSDWGVHETINSYPDRAHNWLLDQILTLGFFGLAINLIFYIFLIYKASVFLLAKPKLNPDEWLLVFLSSSLIGYFINNFFSFSLFTVLVYLYLILALFWIIINYRLEAKIINIRLTSFSKLLISLSLLAVSAVFIYTNNINQIRAEIYYFRALKDLKVFNCKSAINNMDRVISFSPNNSYYQNNYIFLILNCFPLVDKKTQVSFRDSLLEQIKTINNRGSYDILISIARSYTTLGRYFDKTYYAQAEKILNDLILNFPYLTTAYEDLSKQKMLQEDYAGAIEIFNRAINILPPLDHPYLNDHHRRLIETIAVRLYEGEGQAYFKMNNYNLALESYKKGLSLDPYRATLYKNIADVYYIRNNLDEAIRFNQRGMTLNPSDYNWPLALSLLYRDKKELTMARDYLNQAIKLEPENKELKKYYEELNK